jgi:exodeoxyribonuclease V alpha subunit
VGGREGGRLSHLDCPRVAAQNFEQLLCVKGVSKRVIASIEKQWAEKKSLRELVIFLQTHGLPVSLAARLMTAYSSAAALSVLRSNPYKLATEVRCVTSL